MRSYPIRILLILGIILLLTPTSKAQYKYTFGIGGSLISAGEKEPDFQDFVGPTFYFAYSFLSAKNTSVMVESFTSYCSLREGEESFIRRGFNFSSPITFEYRFPDLNIYVGVGPSFFSQALVYDDKKIKDPGMYLDLNAGIGFKEKSTPDNAQFGSNLRMHYLKSLKDHRLSGYMATVSFWVKIIHRD